MKSKFFLILLIVLAFSAIALAQTQTRVISASSVPEGRWGPCSFNASLQCLTPSSTSQTVRTTAIATATATNTVNVTVMNVLPAATVAPSTHRVSTPKRYAPAQYVRAQPDNYYYAEEEPLYEQEVRERSYFDCDVGRGGYDYWSWGRNPLSGLRLNCSFGRGQERVVYTTNRNLVTDRNYNRGYDRNYNRNYDYYRNSRVRHSRPW